MKNIRHQMKAAACLFLSSSLLVSCSKEDLNAKHKGTTTTVTTTTSTSTGTTSTPTTSTTGTSTTTTTTAAVAPTLSVNWNAALLGLYDYTAATRDFRTVSYWSGTRTSVVSGGMLQTTLLANTIGPDGGTVSKIDIPDASTYTLEYDMRFEPGFDFSWGGKTGFGLYVGAGYTGGVPGWDGNGGSFRVMWYKNTSTSPIILKPYVYYKDQPGQYGNDFGKSYPGNGTSIQTGVWYHVKMYAKSNTGSNTDGWARLSINGVTLIDQAIRWTTNDTQRMIKDLCFETFRGGGESYWASSTAGKISYDNMSLVAQ